METNANKNDIVTESLKKYSDLVYRICFIYLKNHADVEDVFQNVFLKLLTNEKPFENEAHQKAWLCRVTINQCKDVCKSFFHQKVTSLEGIELPFTDPEESEVMQAVLSLPSKYKDVIYLFYYEGYSVDEIAGFLDQKYNTIYSKLHRARAILKKKLGGIDHEHNDSIGFK